MQSLCCSQIKAYKDRPNLPDEPKFLAFLEAYPDISQTSGSKHTKYNFIIQLVHGKETSNQESVSKRFFACLDDVKPTPQPPPPTPRPVAKEPAPPPTPASAPAPTPTPAPVPPYRPRIAITPQEPRKHLSPWGSGWNQRSSSASSSSSSHPWGGGGGGSSGIGSGGGGGGSSNPRRMNSNGPPSWVSPDVADSKASWRNPARRSSATSPIANTSPTSPRSPSGGGGRGPSSHFGTSRTGGENRKGPFGSVRAPSSVTSHSERDSTSAWESASNATDTTWRNRFAMLDGESVDDEEASDTSDGIDTERLRELAGSVITQDDEDDFPSLETGPVQSTAGRWQKTGPIKFVEIGEADMKSLYVYVPLEEEDAV